MSQPVMLCLTSLCYRGVLIGEHSKTEENTVVVTALKVFRRLTKQKGNSNCVGGKSFTLNIV